MVGDVLVEVVVLWIERQISDEDAERTEDELAQAVEHQAYVAGQANLQSRCSLEA